MVLTQVNGRGGGQCIRMLAVVYGRERKNIRWTIDSALVQAAGQSGTETIAGDKRAIRATGCMATGWSAPGTSTSVRKEGGSEEATQPQVVRLANLQESVTAMIRQALAAGNPGTGSTSTQDGKQIV